MRKYIFFLFGIVFGLTACNETKTFNVYVGLMNGDYKTVYLQKYVDNTPVTIDSAIILNSKATLKAPVDKPEILYALKVKGMRDAISFFTDNQDVAFNGDIKNPQEISILASESQAEMEAYNAKLMEFDFQIQDLYTVMNDAFATNDTITIDSLTKIAKTLKLEQDNFRDEYIQTHPESFIAHYILASVKQDYPLDQLKTMVGAFTTESIYKDDIKDYISKLERLEVGQPFIDFKLMTNHDTELVLSEIIPQNKLTLVDFWASWCGPCRKEIPFVKAAYEQFHDLGFNLVGVSTDIDESKWLQAVADNQLPGIQVRDTEHKVSKEYLIYYIPSNLLIDQNGTIVAKDLRGEELTDKLAEILKQ